MTNLDIFPAPTSATTRIADRRFRQLVRTPRQAAELIRTGATLAVSGFGGAGHPKAVLSALADLADAALRTSADGRQPYALTLLSGASTAADLDGRLAESGVVASRVPYNADPKLRRQINALDVDYVEVHLSRLAQQVREGYFGRVHTAVVEVAAITEDGELVPGSSIGNNQAWLDEADEVIIEVNRWQPIELDGAHDIYQNTGLPLHGTPIPLEHVDQHIGRPHLTVDPQKVVAVVETDLPDDSPSFTAPDEASRAMAGHILEFLDHEVRAGRVPAGSLLPLQSGVGNVANAVLAELANSSYRGLQCYSELIQDGMIELIDSGVVSFASATALALSPAMFDHVKRNISFYRDRIVLRPQEISNNPELIRRLGVIAMNSMVEADIYGNVNSTHINGVNVVNGLGGSGDYGRNGYLSMFISPSTAKGGSISKIVPFVSHVDHTEHDTQVLITERGLADLRGLSPVRRARVVIDNIAHPDYQPLLHDYLERASRRGGHVPHLFAEAFGWYDRFERTGSMLSR